MPLPKTSKIRPTIRFHSAIEINDLPKNLYGNWAVVANEEERETARRALLHIIKCTLQAKPMRISRFDWVNYDDTIGYKFIGDPILGERHAVTENI